MIKVQIGWVVLTPDRKPIRTCEDPEGFIRTPKVYESEGVAKMVKTRMRRWHPESYVYPIYIEVPNDQS